MEEKSRILNKINKDCFGGSESQLRLLLKYLPDESFKDINLILNNTDFDLIEKDKINILWMQHFVNQDDVKNIQRRKVYTEQTFTTTVLDNNNNNNNK